MKATVLFLVMVFMCSIDLVAQETVSPSTEITICFDAQHTYVSDLGFYLIGPQECGSPIVTLSPYSQQISSANGCCCNGGNDLDSLCFSTTSLDTFNVCVEPVPISGTFGGYGTEDFLVPIDWSPLYGCPINSGSWRAQIFDCIGGDTGMITGAFLDVAGSSDTYFFEIDSVFSSINDNSCENATASIVQFGTDSIIQNLNTLERHNDFTYVFDPHTGSIVFNSPSTIELKLEMYDVSGRLVGMYNGVTGQPSYLKSERGIFIIRVSSSDQFLLSLKLIRP